MWLASWYIIGRRRSLHNDCRVCFQDMCFAAQNFARWAVFILGVEYIILFPYFRDGRDSSINRVDFDTSFR